MSCKPITYCSFFTFIIINILSFIGYIKFDKYTFLLTIILSIPFISSYLDSLNILGNNFNFRKSIDKIENLTIKATQEVENSAESKKEISTKYPSAFSVSQSKELLVKDSTLALASLRIEIEKNLKAFSSKTNIENNEKTSLRKIIQNLNKIGVLSNYHVEALNEILLVCNKAIHGTNVSDSEAKKIIDLAEQLALSFGIGYIPNFNKNNNYKQQGLICEWEHCIEFQPLKSIPDESSCKIFGHDCPGGKETCQKCNKTIKDIM